MAILKSGILGPVIGKVGGVVGFNWKGINALRAYVIPSNPNTAAQQTQRTLFGEIVARGKAILSTIIQTYWDPFYSEMSGFNGFVQLNRLSCSSPFDASEMSVAQGSLEPEVITACTYDDTGGHLVVTWAVSGLGNGELTDSAVIVVYDKVNNLAFVNNGDYTRDDAPASLDIGDGRTPANLEAWLFFYRGTGSELVVSNSSAHAVAAA